jgi:glycosyltransferase involved in cell wall biosynthesis
MSKLLVLVSPEGDAMLRDVYESVLAARDRHEIVVLASSPECKRYRRAGIACAGFRPAGIVGMAMGISRLRKTVQRFAPDVIHAHGFPAVAAALGTLPGSLAARTIATFHDPQRDRELPEKLVERKLPGYLRRAGALTATYPSLARALEARLGLNPGAMSIVPHGVSFDPIDAILARPPARPGPIVGWIGRLAADRSWETAIAAFSLVRDAFPEARLEIAGSGRARQFIVAEVRQRKLSGVVTFRGDVPPRELFATIDLLVVPISRDSMPHAPLEALVAGVPIVAANLGALADVLGARSTAWLVPDDADGFRDGILDAWSRVDDAWAGAAAQRDAARSEYGRPAVAAAYDALYATVVSSERSKRVASNGAVSAIAGS